MFSSTNSTRSQCCAAVGGAEDAALLLRPGDAAERAGEDDVGVGRVDEDAADAAGLVEAHVRSRSCRRRSTCRCRRRSRRCRESPTLRRCRPRRSFGSDGATASAPIAATGMAVEHRRPADAAVGRFPDAARCRAGVIGRRIARARRRSTRRGCRPTGPRKRKARPSGCAPPRRCAASETARQTREYKTAKNATDFMLTYCSAPTRRLFRAQGDGRIDAQRPGAGPATRTRREQRGHEQRMAVAAAKLKASKALTLNSRLPRTRALAAAAARPSAAPAPNSDRAAAQDHDARRFRRAARRARGGSRTRAAADPPHRRSRRRRRCWRARTAINANDASSVVCSQRCPSARSTTADSVRAS